MIDINCFNTIGIQILFFTNNFHLMNLYFKIQFWFYMVKVNVDCVINPPRVA